MQLEDLIKRFREKPYMIDMGKGKLSQWLNISEDDVVLAKMIVRESTSLVDKFRPYAQKQHARLRNHEDMFYDDVIVSKNVLVIGDTHIPYEKKGYLEFCKAQYDKYNCDTVVHIGDLIDSHATSFHPSIPDAYSSGDELKYSIKKLRKWYKAFPNMKVVIGNHDMRAHRLASDSKIASKWVRGYAEVLEVPNWQFEESFEINGTTYVHGTGTSGVTAAYRRMLNLGQNVVIGHLHSEASIIYHKMPNTTLWGMCVGCGVDDKSYGMNYAKNFPKKSIISCGVVLDKQPILNIME